ncbi:MAG: ATP synthase F1 subunit epsilon [Lachnospiraceae bacterium]|nr:ATP synthase F1 subunit epsilon [Lachnospiraceae bacterium]MCR4732198.1 ATP synthase F1 subunit epsilon [Lachnospiraceae bacterium]MEE3355766.1 ATP synthase F1 subunit epsilon [Candidatus Weimeria sp.]
MADTKMFYLRVIAADKTFFQGFAESVKVQQFDGEKEILSHHENMVIALDEGYVRIKPAENAGNGENSEKMIEGLAGMGFAEVMNNRVKIIVESIERPEEIDVARAREAKERAEEQLRQKQSMQEYYHSQASLSRAMARLAAAGRGGADWNK